MCNSGVLWEILGAIECIGLCAILWIPLESLTSDTILVTLGEDIQEIPLLLKKLKSVLAKDRHEEVLKAAAKGINYFSRGQGCTYSLLLIAQHLGD